MKKIMRRRTAKTDARQLPAYPAPDLRLFDCYAHIGSPCQPPLYPALDAEALLAEMDFCGVDAALVHSANTPLASPVVCNQEIADLCRLHRRLQPAWDILPPQTDEMPVERLLRDMRAAGVKVLRARPDEYRFAMNALTCGELFEEISARRIPLFWAARDWGRMHEIVRDFPRLRVVACDLGCWGSDRYFRPLLATSENFYLEISSYELDGGITRLVRKYGAERILFGSGFHYRPMGGASLLVRNLDIPRQAKEMIGHANLERLLRESKP